MNKKFTLFMILLSAVSGMFSCAVSTSSTLQPENEPGNYTAKENTNSCYVVLKDGSRQQYNSLKLVTGVFTLPHLLADGRTKIPASDIIAYQDARHYAVSQEHFINGRKSRSAVEALPGFAVRIAKGKLNIYSKKYYNGSGSSEELYIQVGDEGAIVAFTPELMNTLLRDHPEAFNFFNSRKMNSPVSKKLQATAELFNKEPLLSKN
jgi:hypothetical protein